MSIKKLALSAVFLGSALLALPAQAQTVNECNWQASAANLAEPWTDQTRTFANGNVRLAVLDTIEPAAGAFHVLVLSPPYDEVGGRQCRVVSGPDGIGFGGMAIDRMTASYNPATGLSFTLPISQYDPNNGNFRPAIIGFTLNQATGSITFFQP